MSVPAQDPPEYSPSLRRVKSQDPKEEGRLDANSDSLRKAKSYRKTSLSATSIKKEVICLFSFILFIPFVLFDRGRSVCIIISNQ